MFKPSLLSLSFSLVVSGSALAASPIVLTCNPDEKTKEPEFTVRAEKNGAFSWQQVQSYRPNEKPVDLMKIKGQAKIEAKYGDFVGMDPIVVFTGQSKDGEYIVTSLATRKGKGDTIPGEYKNSRGSGDLACVPGPAFARLAAAMETAPTISTADYRNSQDTILAAVCRPNGKAEATHHLRASHSSFGRVSLMVEDKSKEWGMDSYGHMVFGANGNLVFKENDSLKITHDSQTLARVYVEPKVAKTTKSGKEHRVILVSDLKQPETGMIELYCAEAQAWPTIERYAAEAKQMPKALPKKPGTRAQIDKKLCGDKQYAVARKRMDKWSDLIMDMELPKGADITMMMMGRTKEEKCPTVSIGISTRAGADYVRKVLGESIDGLEIVFEIGEDDEVATATAG